AAPILFHQDILMKLTLIISKFLESHPIGKIYFAPTDVELNDQNIYQPDLLFVSRERSAILKGKRVVGAPDLVIEVLSVGTKDLDLGVKYKVYEQSGILEYWIVDPQKKSFKFYQLKDKLFHEIPVEKEYTSQVLSPLNLSPSDFWDKLKP
ncbi:MAG TPA: Uma2 family endonuclease, partial [Spirochaetes bacterium]|nr:Uma2 family endonuclease [Spirochaetota bacterium]